MTYNEALENFERLLPHISVLMDDKKVHDVCENVRSQAKTMSISKALLEYYPVLMKDHRKEINAILAIELGVDSVEDMPFEEVKKAFKSKVIDDFFTLASFVLPLGGKL